LKKTFLVLVLAISFLSHLSAQTNFTVLARLSVTTGAVPFGSLGVGPGGVLYAANAGGGVSNAGAVVRVNPDGSGFSTLVSFFATNGASPAAGLALASDGTLFGTTYSGGISNFGTIFKLNTNGSGFQVLHYFTGGSDGQNPSGDPIIASNGCVYGVTYYANGTTRGTVYRIDQNGSNYSIIHTFLGTPDGQQPSGRLCQAADGMLYGTTVFGGISAQLGAIYKVSLDGTVYSMIHALQSSSGEGRNIQAGLCQSTNGFLYGTAYSGGTSNAGVIFKLDTDGNNFNIVRNFQPTGGDGQHPNSELVETSDGFLYGGTYGGGSGGGGSFFKIKNDATGYAILQNFSTTGSELNTPNALAIGANGALYGSVRYGGGAGAGCIFALTTLPLPPRILSITGGASSNLIKFAGTYGIHYDVLRSSNLSSWSSVTNLTAPQNGSFSYSDLSPIKPASFYRLHQN
jgi:uncharacterized repeat protein (TIGR03803 family)